MMDTPAALYCRHRFPAEIISHCVWLYFHFCLSYRDIEEMMLVRGVFVTYEAIRQWCQKLARPLPMLCAGGAPGRATHGTSMRSS